MSTPTLMDKINNALALINKVPGIRDISSGPHAIKSGLVLAKLRIEHLEAQLAATETMRDRVAMQLLGDVLVGKLVHNGLNSLSCIQYAYQLADDVMAFRVEAPAALAQDPVVAYADVEFQHDLEDGWYAVKFGDGDVRNFDTWGPARVAVEAAGLTARWVGSNDNYRPRDLVTGCKA